MERVGMILEREGEVLEALLFKLVETRLLLEAGQARFLPRASREVERARARAREVGLVRAATVALIQPGATLRGLADHADGPWPAILRDHHDVLTHLLAEIEVTAHHNDVAARAALDELGGHRLDEPAAMACGSRAVARPGDPGVVDGRFLDPARDSEIEHLARGVAYDAVLGTAARLHMPDLVDFLH